MVRHVSTPPPASTALRSPILQRAFAAFTYRDFRVLWFGAFASTVGTWMQKVAQSWLVFDLTKSSFYLGLDDFLGQLPILLFTLLGGVIADRHDRKRLLIGSQFVQMATAFALAALVFQGRVHIGHILALSFTAGLAQAFGGPAYQAMIPSLIHKKDLPNAIALNSIQFNLARVFGPLVRRRHDGDARRGRLLHAQRRVVPARDRGADVALGEAHPAGRSQTDAGRAQGRASPTRAASRPSSP